MICTKYHRWDVPTHNIKSPVRGVFELRDMSLLGYFVDVLMVVIRPRHNIIIHTYHRNICLQ